jgi:hypothetical protein
MSCVSLQSEQCGFGTVIVCGLAHLPLSQYSPMNRKPRLLTKGGHSSRWIAGLSRGLLASAAIAAISTMPAAQVPNGPEGLKAVGPTNPYNGYPYWYEDHRGIRLGICADPNRCFFGANPSRAVHFPQSMEEALAGDFNWPDELFYFAAENLEIATLPARARVMFHVAIEGAMANEEVIPGDQTSFARLRIRLRDMQPNSEYTIKHPYGEEVITTEADGSAFYTRDIGLQVGVFTGALYGDVGPFLLPVGFDPQSPPGTYLSDGGLTLERVTGSPIGRNYVQYEGPGIGNDFPNLRLPAAEGPDPTTDTDVIRSELFSLQGQIAAQNGVGIEESYYTAQGTAPNMTTGVVVFARSAPGQELMARVAGSTWVTMAENADTGTYLAKLGLGSNNAVIPSDLEVINVSDTPISLAQQADISDLVTVQSASYTIGGNLVVAAASSDRSASRQMSVRAADYFSAPQLTAGLGDANFNLQLPVTFVPPTDVQVTSSAGGSVVFPLHVLGAGKTPAAAPTTGPVADAGVDMTVDLNTVIELNGAASQGDIARYGWLAPAIGFEKDNATSIGSVLRGRVVQAGDLSFQLTVVDIHGQLSTDTVVVHVNPGPAVVDNITVLTARYSARRDNWLVTGSSSELLGQDVSIYFAMPDPVTGQLVKDPTRLIGTATVDEVGGWRYREGNTRPEQAPGAGDTSLFVESALGGTATFPIDFR